MTKRWRVRELEIDISGNLLRWYPARIRVSYVSPASTRTSAITYSFVIPVYDEGASLGILRERMSLLMPRLDGEVEVILVDDGSKDASWELISAFHREDRRFKGVRLARNFGHQMAITAGMDMAVGQAVIVMDADLQDPPETVLEMAERWREGYQVVYGVRQDRSTDSCFKRTTASAFYWALARLTDVNIPRNVGDFRLIDRAALNAFRSMREGSRFVRGMYSWVGFRQIGVPYTRGERLAGETKYPLRKMLRLAWDGIFSFSRVPLRVAMKVGAFTAFLSVLGALVAVSMKLFGGYGVPGWTSIVLAVCLLGSMQLVVLGVIGQYIGRIYEESLARPLYIASDLTGIPTPMGLIHRAVYSEPSTVAEILGESTDEPGAAAVLDLTKARRPESFPQ
jgi:polyisoprenyl-phosphate glycosyltransferase